MSPLSADRSPGVKLGLAILVGFLLTFPLMMVWLLVIDRQSQSEFAQAGIAEGWGGPQAIGGPLLVIPYRADAVETATENGAQVTRTRQVWEELTLAPEQSEISTEIRPEQIRRSIYEVVVYEAAMSGRARFAIPADLARFGVTPQQLDLSRAELRFGLSDPRGLGANPRVSVGGRAPAPARRRLQCQRRRRLLRLARRRPARRRPDPGRLFLRLPRQSLAGPGSARRRDALAPALALAASFVPRQLPAQPAAGRRRRLRGGLPRRQPRARPAPGFDRRERRRSGRLAARSGPARGRNLRRRAGPRTRRRTPGRSQPDPAGRSLFAGQPRHQIRLPVHRLHLPRAPDVRRDRRRARVGG